MAIDSKTLDKSKRNAKIHEAMSCLKGPECSVEGHLQVGPGGVFHAGQRVLLLYGSVGLLESWLAGFHA